MLQAEIPGLAELPSSPSSLTSHSVTGDPSLAFPCPDACRADRYQKVVIVMTGQMAIQVRRNLRPIVAQTILSASLHRQECLCHEQLTKYPCATSNSTQRARSVS